ncbi:MAG: glycosyltransferase family 87 protein [Dehalococcoidia bacterium]
MTLLDRVRSRRFLHDALAVAGIIVVVFVWWLIGFNDYQHDARAYWTVELSDPYAAAEVGGKDAYLYSPLFAQLTSPLTLLPWEVFRPLWAAVNLGALVWLAGPIIGALLLVVPGSPLIDEVGTGNIHLLIAAAIVAGFRYPPAWGFNLLTKVTPGIGLLYFVGARQWRHLALAIGLTAAISLVSFAVAPGLWLAWIEVLITNTGARIPDDIAVIPGSLALRTAIAGIIAIGGGILGWRWTAAVAATLALPVPWSSGLSVLVAVIALWRFDMLREPRRPFRTHLRPSTPGQREAQTA